MLEVATLATWDAARDLHVMAGGRLLAPAPPRLRPRTLWDLPLPGAKSARVALEWSGPEALDVEVRIGLDPGQTSEPATLRLIDETTRGVTEVPLPPLSAPVHSTSGSVNTRRVTARPGVRLQAELLVGGEVAASHSLTP